MTSHRLRMKEGRSERTVRIVFDLLDCRGNVFLGALEVDHSVASLVASATETRRDASVVVSSAGSFYPFVRDFSGLLRVTSA